MKRSSVLILAAMIALAASASLYSQEANLELVRADLKAQKVALVTMNMQLTDAQSQVFWPIYRKYDAELTVVYDKVISLVKDYAANYAQMTDAKAAELMKGTLSLMGQRLKLLEKVCGDVAKALGPVLGARFMQIERQITAALDLQIGSGMPLIQK